MSTGTSSGVAQTTSTSASTDAHRQSNLQKIALKKVQMRSWPKSRKMERLAVYSSCQADDGSCKCTGWMKSNEPSNLTRLDLPVQMASLDDPCSRPGCQHPLYNHYSHLEDTSEEKLNRILGISVDVDNLSICVHKEEDPDTKPVYFYLFRVLRKSIIHLTVPIIDRPLGNIPFETPNIAKGVMNFVIYKFGKLAKKEWQNMYDLAKMYLLCLNHLKLETPSTRRQHSSNNDDASTYKINYTRWLFYCQVPAFCDSLTHYETTHIFGRTLLRSVFQTMRRQLLDKFRAEKDDIPLELRSLILTDFPRFLSMLEEEVYAPNSCIWDLDFRQTTSHLVTNSL